MRLWIAPKSYPNSQAAGRGMAHLHCCKIFDGYNIQSDVLQKDSHVHWLKGIRVPRADPARTDYREGEGQ